MRSFLQQLEESFTLHENHLGVDENNYIEVEVRDARFAGEIYADIKRNYEDIVNYGSNVYASNNAEELYDLLTVFEQEKIGIISKEFNDELDEQNVTGAFPGISTPNAFRKKTKKVSYASGIEESVTEIMDRKYEQLIEGYRKFANGDSKVSPEKKVKSTIQEIAKKLQEIETLVNYNSRLKEESGVTSTAYGPSTTKALTKISERLIKISERVRSLGE